MPSSAATSRVRLNTDELHQLKWVLGQLLALIAMWSLWSLASIPHALLLLFFIGTVAVTVRPMLIARIPDWINKAATPALILVISVDFIMHSTDFLDPMVRMVGFLTLYRAMQFRKRREDLQLLLLTLFTLIIVGVLLVSLSFAAQMLVFTPIAMGQLFLVNLLESSHNRVLVGADWQSFSWRRFIVRLRHGLDFRLISFAGVLFAVVVGVSSVIFVSLPRIQMDQALPFLQLQSTAGIGFNDTISYGDVNDLLEGDDRIALRVEVSDPDRIPSRPYWRMVVLDQYDPNDSTFRVSPALRQFTNSRIREGFDYTCLTIPQRTMTGHTIDSMAFYLEGNISKYLPLIGPFDSIVFSQRVKFFPAEETNVFELDATIASRLGYSLEKVSLGESLVTARSEQRALDRIMGSPILTGENPQSIRDLNYPETTLIVATRGEDLQFLQDAVEEITGGERIDPAEFSSRAMRWLHDRYEYSLSTGLSNDVSSDHLVDWMRQADQGWCEHFAGAFIMLARTAGIPARAIAGFAGATWNDYEDYFVVRNRMAHAWVEIYDGKGRWVRVDPTPAADFLGGFNAGFSAMMETESGWSAWLDSVRMVWYRRVVNFDQSDQQEIAANLRDASVGAYGRIKTQIQENWTAFKAWMTEGWDFERIRNIALIIALICFSILAIRGLYRAALTWRSDRASGRGRTASDPIRRKAGSILTRFRPAYQNAQSKLAEPELKPWREVYRELIALRFGDRPNTQSWRATLKSARQLMRGKAV